MTTPAPTMLRSGGTSPVTGRTERQIEEAYMALERRLTDDDIAAVLLPVKDTKTTRTERVGTARYKAGPKRARIAELSDDQLWEQWATRSGRRLDRHLLHTCTANCVERVEFGMIPDYTDRDDEPLFVLDDEPVDVDPDFCEIQPGCWMFADDSGNHGGTSVLDRLIELDPEMVVITDAAGCCGYLSHWDCVSQEHTIAEACEIFGADPTTPTRHGFRVFKPRGETYA